METQDHVIFSYELLAQRYTKAQCLEMISSGDKYAQGSSHIDEVQLSRRYFSFI